MTTLLLADHDNGILGEATARVVSAARQIGGDIDVLVAGKDCAGVAAEAARIAGVAKVLLADDDSLAHLLAEPLSALLVALAANYDVVIGSTGSVAKNVLPRVAALLDVMQISEIIAVDGPAIFKRPIYAGNAIETLETTDAKKIITVRTTAFEAAAGGNSAPVAAIAVAASASQSSFVSRAATKSDRPDLGSAKIVVSGGRALGSKAQFDALMIPLAEKLNAAIGASRAAVDAGFVPSDYQVGQTGKAVAPALYIACGISGAIQHLAGMKESKVIVAINKDAEAPIFAIADYGLVADIFTALPELTAKL